MQHLLRYLHSGNEVMRFNGDAAVFVLKKKSGIKLSVTEKMMICRSQFNQSDQVHLLLHFAD